MPDSGARARRDDRSFEGFVADRGSALLRTAVFLTGDRQGGEDLLQDVLLRAYRRWADVDDPESYLRRALVNASVSRARRWPRGREQLVAWDEPGPDLAVSPGGLVDVAGRVGDRHDLLGALRQLPPRQRAVIVLRYFDDLSEAEIATELGCGAGTVKTHAARGLSRLRELMGPLAGSPAALSATSPTRKGMPT
ncbi:SigE family RNA polymerase sigma factor [Frankia sp. CNm7]|uniref:SigE family RNA polymerase sigma factor n=1 Tax=Frankia nepalensis TaxID=1836974 RepID=A0A937RN94_9ACTN|nr:SigE family RNA polymerase sigma factor [Frankia nepalensis]MBL7502588.1 SigE family RNA polymerase sigma factor [Frankia nepalensis]MBL7514743.1 SigE family RNA polymerase sigma factor [Frankia nepalensis]MBL7523002.1 SigE family RNA polymerase sigma factor [Frankia nepalensis]MBL7628976.1 SigE family RNA polymerase sigma factor [Frankia nepalensis]